MSIPLPLIGQGDDRAEIIFFEALKKDPDRRDGFLKEECGADTRLRVEVDGLLRDHEKAGSFLSVDAPVSPALEAEFARLRPEESGEKIGPYKLLQQIGEGGCGTVWMAEQEQPVRRRVALKIIKLGMDTRNVIARFEAERQALAMMDHPNIAKVLDAGATETGRPYFVMELVRGTRITDYCDQNSVSTEERLALFNQVCHAIQHAHQKGIIHRDIKPSNILVTLHDGVPVPRVIDFGISKATTGERLTDKTIFTAFEQFIGTPAYMSPEQAELSGLDVDTRSDIYALGVLLYELLTGKTPFDAKVLMEAGVEAMRRTIRDEEPPRPSTRLSTMMAADLTMVAKQRGCEAVRLTNSVRGDLDWIVMKAMEKDRTRRYETASGMARDIQRHLNNEPVLARAPSNRYRLQKLIRRNKLAFIAAIAVLAALIVGLGISTWMFFKERHARDRAVAAEKAEARERKTAEIEASKSRQVAQFLTDMLTGVGPSVALGDDTKMLRKIMDKTVERLAEDLKDQPDVEADLRNVIGNVYLALGEYAKAEAMHADVLATRRKLLGNEHSMVAAALNNLAGDLASQGKPAAAEGLYREALAMNRKLGRKESIPTTLHNLASVLLEQGKLAEAETLQREALEIYRRLFGNESLDLATSLDSLALVLQSVGKLAEGETAQREALAMKRKLLGKEHPEVATSLNNLGVALLQQGKFAEAETTQREALAMKQKLLNNEHPEVATALLNLAHLLRRQLKLVEAETMYREALAMHRKFLGNEHRDVGASLNGLAIALHKQGKGAEAEVLLREAIAILTKGMGNEHPDLAQALDNLAVIMEGQQKYPEAESLQRESLAMSRKLLGTRHPQVAASLKNLRNVLLKQGKTDEANALLRDEIAAARSASINDPVEFEGKLYQFADTLYRQHQYAEAESLYREVIERRQARLTAENRDVLRPIASLARLLAEWAWVERAQPAAGGALRTGSRSPHERAHEAERLLRDSLVIVMRGTDAASWLADEMRSRLGGALVSVAVTDPALNTESRSAKFTEAETLLLQAHESLQTVSQSGASKLQRDALTRLVRLYEAWEKTEKISEWQQKLADVDQAEANTGSANVK